MMQHAQLEHKFVNDIPEYLAPGIIYISVHYAIAVHLCCCGCAREVVTPLAPTQWKMTFDGETISLHPSIGSWNLPCRSHYIIKRGRVIEAGSWSEKEVDHGKARDKRARAAYYQAAVIKEEGHAIEIFSRKPRRNWLAKIIKFFNSP